jgi:hypothetical protein
LLNKKGPSNIIRWTFTIRFIVYSLLFLFRLYTEFYFKVYIQDRTLLCIVNYGGSASILIRSFNSSVSLEFDIPTICHIVLSRIKNENLIKIWNQLRWPCSKFRTLKMRILNIWVLYDASPTSSICPNCYWIDSVNWSSL